MLQRRAGKWVMLFMEVVSLPFCAKAVLHVVYEPSMHGHCKPIQRISSMLKKRVLRMQFSAQGHPGIEGLQETVPLDDALPAPRRQRFYPCGFPPWIRAPPTSRTGLAFCLCKLQPLQPWWASTHAPTNGYYKCPFQGGITCMRQVFFWCSACSTMIRGKRLFSVQ